MSVKNVRCANRLLMRVLFTNHYLRIIFGLKYFFNDFVVKFNGKFLLTGAVFLFIGGTVIAAPPATPYDLGETLAPSCAPGDINCTVVIPQARHDYLDDVSAVSALKGDILYFDGGNWMALNAGLAGETLQMGVGGVPFWGSASTSVWQQAANVLSPVDAAVYRVKITNNSASTLTGFQAVNTNDVHNYAGAVVEVKGSGPDYTNNMFFGKYSENFYVPSWAGNGVIATDQDLVLSSVGATDVTNPNPDPQIVFQVGGGYTAPINRMTLNSSGLAFSTGVRIGSILDEDDFVSNSNTALATQQSIKAYVDGKVVSSLQDLDTDTYVRVESVPDEDIVRFGTAGIERMYINSNGYIGVDTDSPLVSVFTVGPGPHENGVFSVSGKAGYMNIANFRDQDGESIFRSRGSFGNNNLEITFGDHQSAYDKPYIGIFSNGDYYDIARGEIRLLSNVRTDYIGFMAPASVPANVVWTLPNVEGANGQALVTDGAGTLSWQYVKAGSSNGAPPAGDCDEDAERGKMVLDYSGNNFYICNGAARGWDYVALID